MSTGLNVRNLTENLKTNIYHEEKKRHFILMSLSKAPWVVLSASNSGHD